jgi:glutamine synthetase
MSEPNPPELLQILTTDLVAITRGRSVPADAPGWRVQGCGWVPANHALDPFGAIATPNPWGAIGDLRLRPDVATETRVDGIPGRPPLHMVLADIAELDGTTWACCPRDFLRRALADLELNGLSLVGAFEHEFTLAPTDAPPAPSFSLTAQRRAEPLLSHLFAALRRAGVAPEMILPEYGADQFEVTCAPAAGMIAADRAVVLREVVRDLGEASGRRASFSPKPTPDGVGNGVHIHFSLRDADRTPVTYDPAGPGGLSGTAAAFVAGVLRHMPALCAITAPAPVSYLRLVPHHWSAAYACLGERNREASLRICPLPATATDPARAFNVEYRAVDATANPYLALGVLVRAGLAGLRDGLPAPPLVHADPADLTEAERASLGATRLPDSLGAALACLSADAEAVSWFPPDLLAAYHSLKAHEIALAEGLSADALCRRYSAIY